MRDPRGKKVHKGLIVSALIGNGAQVSGRVCRVTADEILFEADVNLPVQPETPTGALVLIGEGVEELAKEKWKQPRNKKLKIMDQRDNQIVEGVEIVALMPSTLQIFGEITECRDASLVSMRGGKGWRIGQLTLKAFIPLPVTNGRATCLIVPPSEEGDDAHEQSSNLILPN